MVEPTSPQSNVLELRDIPRGISVEIDGSIAYEVILTLWINFSDREEYSNFELGPDWHSKLSSKVPEDLSDEILALGGPHCSVWLSLLGLIATAPRPHDPDRVFEWLGDINPQRLRRWMLGYIGEYADSSLVEDAANGNLDAVREIVATHQSDEVADHMVTLFEMDPEQMRERLVATLSRFRSEVFAEHEELFAGAIDKAATAQRAVLNRDDPKKVIEEATQGLDYEIPPGVQTVILIPSVVVRPLSLIDQQRGTLLVIYGITDEFIESDPEAPPSWLVRTYKALSDERRLRILRRLGQGETSLDELTNMLGLSKSTVHHHISILRGAGLVRVQVRSQGKKNKHDKTSRYSLRPNALDNASDVLHTYILTNHQTARRA